jgi:hypothetical protein|tara:strand:- start:4608 stop:5036 length:429 start_codon:yes stop_codon:yes gene_type:complete
MFDFLSGMGGSLTSILPTFGGLTQGAGNLFSGFLGDSPMEKPKTPMMMPNIQQPGGNFLLDNMTPEVAGVFQGMGVKPEGFAMQPTQQNQGLLNQGSVNIQAPQAPVFNAPQMPVYNQRQQITPVDLQQYYRNLMSSRQGIL